MYIHWLCPHDTSHPALVLTNVLPDTTRYPGYERHVRALMSGIPLPDPLRSVGAPRDSRAVSRTTSVIPAKLLAVDRGMLREAWGKCFTSPSMCVAMFFVVV